MDAGFVVAGMSAVFNGFDVAILQFMHGIAEWAGFVLTPFFAVVSFIGEQGIAMFVLALVLMAFRSTRKMGVCIFLAVCLGALVTNVILKDIVARPRPFEDEAGVYRSWWQFVGSQEESGYSFPSGHVTAAMAGMTTLFLSADKRVAWVGFLYAALMALSRTYLMVHYPTDVLAALVIGAAAALASFSAIQAASRFAEKNRIDWYYQWFYESADSGRETAFGQQGRHVRTGRF